MKWDSMPKTEIGAWCKVCKSSVIDFSEMSTESIIKYIENHNGRICGKIQVQKFNTKHTNQNFNNWKIVLAGILVFIGVNQSTANPKSNQPQDNSPLNLPSGITVSLIQKTVFSDSVVIGHLLDSETKDPIPGAMVWIKETSFGTTSDLEGKFSLEIPENIRKKKFKIIISFIGYINEVVEISPKDLPFEAIIELKEDRTPLIGEIIITRSPKRWWQFWRKKY